MHLNEIEYSLARQAGEVAKSENKSLAEFVSFALGEQLRRRRRLQSDEERVRRFAESYEKIQQKPEGWEFGRAKRPGRMKIQGDICWYKFRDPSKRGSVLILTELI